MGAKMKSKTHLQDTFFDFLGRFLRVWLQSFQKVLYDKTKLFGKNQKRYQKTKNFTLISNPLKKLFKNAPKWTNEIANAHKTAKKTENLFYECVLEFN